MKTIYESDLQYYTNKYEDVISAIESIDPGIFERDLQAASLRAQIDAMKSTLYNHVLRNHCVPDTE